MTKPIYVLGTGLSHDGSSCLLKDGRVIVAIEKERLTRRKHDGGNDHDTVRYCLEAAGVRPEELSLVVQAANFEKDSIRRERYRGRRFFPENLEVPFVTLSHHLAHAWSAVGTAPFESCQVIVIDGAGSPVEQCDDWVAPADRDYWRAQVGLHCEKDSFYHFDGRRLLPLFKDFSPLNLHENPCAQLRLPTNTHSIGGLYSAVSHYCFGGMDDAGKLMGLAPYGRDTHAGCPLFRLDGGRVEVDYRHVERFDDPAPDHAHFKSHFQHYADLARWVQRETERAVLYVMRSRLALQPHANLAYAGGVALNAVTNAALLRAGLVERLYVQPAAGDNGLALGCVFYGWREVLGRERVAHDGSVFFGRSYATPDIEAALATRAGLRWTRCPNVARTTAAWLAAGKVVAWFQGGAEFGPRALGHRSILADPRLPDIALRINRDIKFREDFRPFAPAVLPEAANRFFQDAWDSPHMILIDRIRPEWRERLPAVVHVDGTCRVQTVDAAWNPLFAELLRAFDALTGVPVLLNTSLNRRGMPIVETPAEALEFFLTCALDVLIVGDYVVEKTTITVP